MGISVGFSFGGGGVKRKGEGNSYHEVTGVSLAVYITKISGAFWYLFMDRSK